VILAVFPGIPAPNARNQPWPPKSAAVRVEKSPAIRDWPDELDATPPGTCVGARFSERTPFLRRREARGPERLRQGNARNNRLVIALASIGRARSATVSAPASTSGATRRRVSGAPPCRPSAQPQGRSSRGATARGPGRRAERQRSLWPGKARLTGAERQRSRGSSDEASYETIPEARPRPTCSAPGSVRPARWGVGGAPEHPPFRVTPGGEHLC
jgi:hypothetical protein